MKTRLLLALCICAHLFSFSQTTSETFSSGSFIVNMGSTNPQTIANGLKPYGMIYDLIRNYGVPVKWVIGQGKSKDGLDFTYNAIGYKGGTFLIPSQYRSAAVNSRITYWMGQGVEGSTTTSSVTLPVFKTLTSVPRWTLDTKNGWIAQGFLTNAGITTTAFSNSYNWNDPATLGDCDDLFVLPHADPTWATHGNLYNWNRNYKGAIWSGCHAVSVLENMYNPSNPNQKTNFLSKTGLVMYTDHANGSPPYVHRLPSDAPAQYMGVTDAAQQNGSEQIYIPQTQWRNTTNIVAYDPTQQDVSVLNADLSNAAASVVYGRAWGDSTSNCGWVLYEAGHNLNKGSTGDVASQRIFFDFSFFVSSEKVPKINSITGITAGSFTAGNQTISLNANATPGVNTSSIVSYQWTVSVNGGSFTTSGFSNPNGATTNYTLPNVGSVTSIIINLTVTDNCGRYSFSSIPFSVTPPGQPPVANNDMITIANSCGPGVATTINALANDTDPQGSAITFLGINQSSATPPGAGTWTATSSGMVTFTPAENFAGAASIQYSIINTYGLTSTATINVGVGTADSKGCYPNQFWGVANSDFLDATTVGTSNGVTIGTGLDDLESDASAGSYVDMNLTTSNYITFNLPATLNIGDTVVIYWAKKTNNATPATLSFQASTGGAFGNTQVITTTNTSLTSPTITKVPITVNGTTQIKVNTGNLSTSTASGDDPLIDVIEWDQWSCVSKNPNGNDDNFVASEDDPVTLPVLNNDGDPQGLPLTLTAIVTAPTKGKLSINLDGTITYLGNRDTNGSDQFTYKVCNSQGYCDVGTVNITIQPDGCGANTYRPVPTSAPTTVAFLATADNYLNQASNTHNYGNTTTMYVGKSPNSQERPIVKFDLSSIPANAIVLDATIKLSRLSGQVAQVINVHKLTQSWNETKSSWNNTSTGPNVPWTTAGGTYSSTVAAATTVGTTNGRYLWSVGPLAQEWINSPSTNYGALFKASNTTINKWIYFGSSENATTSARDSIYITYKVPLPCQAIPNRAPLANPDTTTTNSVTPVTISVLNNDYDQDPGDVLSLLSLGTITNGTAVISGNNIVFTPTYGFNGTASVIYNVKDAAGLTDQSIAYIKVTNAPPQANKDSVSTLSGNAVTINVEANDNDPEGGSLSAPSITLNPKYGVATVSGNNIIYTPIAGFTGKDTLIYQLCEASAANCSSSPLCDTALVVILVQNRPPVAGNDTKTTVECQSVYVDVLNNDSDPENGELTVSIVTQPAAGTATVVGGARILYTPPPGYTGTVTIGYKITDDGTPPLSSTATVTITVSAVPANLPPVALNDAESGVIGAPLYVDVLSNDYDPEGQPLTISLPGTLLQPHYGTLSITPNGLLVKYTPNPGFVGVDSFEYKVCDPGQVGGAGCPSVPSQCTVARVYVTVTALNTTYAVNDQNNTWMNTAVSGNVMTNDFDIEGDTQNFNSFLQQNLSGVLSSGSTVAGTSLTGSNVANAGSITFNSFGNYTFTPANGFTGVVTLPYKICDNAAINPVCDTAYLTLTVDSLPTLSNSVLADNDENVIYMNQTATGNVLWTDKSPRANSVSVTAIKYDNTGTGNITTSGTLGSGTTVGGKSTDGISVSNAGTLTINSNGTYTFVATPGFTGAVTVIYTVCDNATPAECKNQFLHIDVLPDVNGNANDRPFGGDDFNYTTVNVPVSGNFINNDSDPNNDAIKMNGVTINTGGTHTPIGSTIATVMGGTIQFYADGNYLYTPPNNYFGPDRVIYSICDVNASSLCASATINFLIAPGIQISGLVWDDKNGSVIKEAGEVGTNAGGLYVNLVDNTNKVVAVVSVTAAGTYTFTNVTPGQDYTLVLSTTQGTIGATAPSPSLPNNWVNIGENMNGTTKTTNLGKIPVPARYTDAGNQNFGIEQLPDSDPKGYTLSYTPTLNSTITLNGTGADPGKLTGTDPEDGALSDGKTVVITSVPAQAELYYNGVLLTNGFVINNYDPSLLVLKFTTTGISSTSFTYAYVDAAGKQDPTPATYIIVWGGATFSPINISGKVWDDANGSITKDGSEVVTNAGGLYAILADNTNTVVAVSTVAANGTYSFTGITPNNVYTIVLSTSNGTIGNPAPSASLPSNWVNTGENMNGTIKTTNLGNISFSAPLTDVTNMDFGIEQLPNSDDKYYTLPDYPRLNTTITLNGTGSVPGKLTGTDPEDGALSNNKTVVITSVPTATELYYNGVLLVNGDIINNYDPNLLTIKFTTVGITSTSFKYAYFDAANRQDPTPGIYTITWTTAIPQPINISGKVWNDANGSITKDGSEIVTDAGGLYAVLADNASNTVAIATVNSNGTYSFSNVDPNFTYKIILTTNSAIVGNAAPSASLPSNWVNTGENMNGTTKTTSPGIITIAPTLLDVVNQDFGIEQLPNSDDKNYTLPDYPRLNTSITLNGTGSAPDKLTGTDPEDGVMQDGKKVIITTVPGNAQLYYNGTLVTNGFAISNYDPSLLSVKFTTVGATSVVFNYAYVDAANKQDPTPATYVISWSTSIPQPLNISGKVWDDANGSVTKDGSEVVTNAGGLYAILTDASNNTIAISSVAANGTYSFTNIDPNHSYNIVLSTSSATVGNPAPSPSLPSNWVNTGENMNGTTETTTPGVIILAPAFNDIVNEDFGIEQLPNSDDKSYTLPDYPRLNTSITLNGTGSVPGKLTGTDPEDGLMQEGKKVVITTVPNNAELFYNGTPVTNGFTITNYDPSLLSVLFNAVGATSVVFHYAYVDAAGKQDLTPATYTITWTTAIPQPITISGVVWDDADGSVIINGGESATDAGGLYAILTDNSSNTVAVSSVSNADGTYNFSNIDPNHTYKIVLSTLSATVGNPAPSPSLPFNWVNTGENMNGTIKTTSLGVITLAPTISDVVNENFGIEQLPNSDDKYYTLPDYPRLNTSITLNGTGLIPGKLTGSDPEDGALSDGKTVVITTIPTNAQLYYNGTLITNGFTINNYNPSLLLVKFTTVGATSVTFNYAYVDAASKQDPTPGTYTITWTTAIPQPINISGKVWDDADGSITMSGSEVVTNAGGLYAILADASNITVAVSSVAANGTYSFSNIDPDHTYKIILSTSASTISTTASSPSLPSNWVNTGENMNGTTKTTSPGVITIAPTLSDVVNQDFGIEQLPNSHNKSYNLSSAPTLNSTITLNGTGVDPGKLTGIDPEDGALSDGKTVVITTVPSNTELYYNGTLVTNGFTITNYDPSLLLVKFTTTGATSTNFQYAYVDAAGKQDPTPATYVINWGTSIPQPITISGKVWDDADGSVIMNGSETVTNAGGLFAILSDNTNTVIAVTSVSANGTYSFSNIQPNNDFTITLSKTSATVGSTALSPSLPSNWVNTGENSNGTINATSLGVINFTSATTDMTNMDFGIEQLPNSDDKYYTLPDYPRLNTSITLNGTGSVPGKLTGSDPEDGALADTKTVVITTVPNNAQLYYNGTLITNGFTINNYDPSLLLVKFTTVGATSVTFNYAYVDAASKQDPTPGTYTITWTTPIPQPINISGKVWDDADGSVTLNGSEVTTNGGGGMYVILANNSGNTVAVTSLNANGTYSFNNIDPNTPYSIILSNVSLNVGDPSPPPSLHMNWVNTGENMNGTTETATPGLIVVAGTYSNVINQDFGIEQLPNSDDKSFAINKPDPNSTLVLNNISGSSGKLTGTDPEDGFLNSSKTVVITQAPNFGELYYNGVLVTNGFTITNYDPSLLYVKFTGAGYSSVMFRYAFVDAAGQQDPVAAFYYLVWPGTLPLQSITTTAVLQQNNVQVNWNAKGEINIHDYVVERSVDGSNFIAVGNVAALNNGKEENNYTLNDDIINVSSAVIYYRVRQNSNDNKAVYSNIVVVKRNNVDVSLSHVYPNPFASELNIVINSSIVTKADILLTDVRARVIRKVPVQILKGTNSLSFQNLETLGAGTYMIIVKGEEINFSAKVIKAK